MAKVRLDVLISDSIDRKLRRYCADRRMCLSHAVEDAIDGFIGSGTSPISAVRSTSVERTKKRTDADVDAILERFRKLKEELWTPQSV